MRSAGQTITSLDLVTLSSGSSVWTAPEGIAPDEESNMRLFISLIAGYRYGIASEVVQGDYKSTVLGKINQVTCLTLNLTLPLPKCQGARHGTIIKNSEL